jgi:hypothetical protein
MLGAQPVLDAGDAQHENLGAAGGISVIAKIGILRRVRGLFGPALFFGAALAAGMKETGRGSDSRFSRCASS